MNYTHPQLRPSDPDTYWHTWWFLKCPKCGVKKYRTQAMRGQALRQFHARHGTAEYWTVELVELMGNFTPSSE